MFLKKACTAFIGAGFLAALATTPALAADVSISGYVETHLQSYSSTSSAQDNYIKVNSAGSGDTFSHMYTHFYESELKFKAKGKTPQGWKTGAEIELELGQNDKNDFELEEASAYVDFGSIKLIGGILEDWSLYTGHIISDFTAKWLDTKVHGSDESPAFRLAVTSVENLKLDVKLRFGEDTVTSGTYSIPVGQNETRVQGRYNFGMGYAQVVYATVENKPVDSNSAGDYAFKDSAQEIAVGLKFGSIEPWISMITRKKTETAAAVGSSEAETKDTQMLIGANFKMSDALALTGIYLTHEEDTGGSEKAKLTSMDIGVAYNAKPVTFRAVYASMGNNYSTYNGSGDDAKLSGLDFSMEYKF